MKITLKHLVDVAIFTLISLVIFASLAPPWETGSREIEVGRAYSEVRTLRDEFAGEALHGPILLEQLDPWGNAYVLQAIDDGQWRVTSAGPDGVLDSMAAGTDDIWSDMPTSPLEPFHTQRKWELARAFAIGSITWIALMAAYWWSERSLARRRASPATDSSTE